MRKLLLASIFGLLLLAPTALADSSTIVRLKSGAEYHGQIVEKVPGDHLTLQLATGEVKRFAWSEIVSDSPDVVQPPPASPPPASYPPSPFQPSASAPDPGQMSFVHIDVKNPDDHVSLMHIDMMISMWVGGRAGGATMSSTVCQAPCDKWVPAADNYFIGGRGLTNSRTFDLRVGERAMLAVDAGSAVGWWGGYMLTLIGTSFTVSGGLIVGIGSGNSDLNSLTNMGWGFLAGGVVCLVIGIPLWLHNRTKVEKSGGDTQALDHQMMLDALSGTIRF
jgi:hypothetical protein